MHAACIDDIASCHVSADHCNASVSLVSTVPSCVPSFRSRFTSTNPRREYTKKNGEKDEAEGCMSSSWPYSSSSSSHSHGHSQREQPQQPRETERPRLHHQHPAASIGSAIAGYTPSQPSIDAFEGGANSSKEQNYWKQPALQQEQGGSCSDSYTSYPSYNRSSPYSRSSYPTDQYHSSSWYGDPSTSTSTSFSDQTHHQQYYSPSFHTRLDPASSTPSAVTTYDPVVAQTPAADYGDYACAPVQQSRTISPYQPGLPSIFYPDPSSYPASEQYTPQQPQQASTLQSERYKPLPAAATGTRRGGQTQLGSYSSSSSDPSYYENPTCTWPEFLAEWAALLALDPQAHIMQHTNPTFADVEDLCYGLANSGHRVTVDKLKTIIRGINQQSRIHLKLSGTKLALLNSVTAHLRRLAADRSPEYTSIARLVGEAQGYAYPGGPTGGAAGPVAGVPTAAGQPHAGPSSAATASTSASAAAAAGSRPAYKVYPQNGYNPSAGPSTTSNSYYAPSRPQDFQMKGRSAAAGAGTGYTRSPASSAVEAVHAHPNGFAAYANGQHQFQAPSNGSNSGASSYPTNNSPLYSTKPAGAAIPTSWPKPLPARPAAMAGQPAVPINFKPSPFYKIVAAVSSLQTMARRLRLSFEAFPIFLSDLLMALPFVQA